MKKFFLFFACLLGLVLMGRAYQTGGPTRPNFAPKPAESQAAVPGQSGVQTRTFSSYGARQGAWRRGVKTETVQTQSAAEVRSQEKEFTPIPTLEQEPVAKVVEKKEPVKKAVTPKATALGAQAPAEVKPTQASTQPAAAPAMPAAMAEQLQGLQKMMSGLGGVPGGNTAGADAAGGAAAGMPDLSAILNAMPGAQQPKK